MKKLKSTKSIPLSYIQSVLKIDLDSPSGLTWLPREDGKFKFDNNHAGYKQRKKSGYQQWVTSISYVGKSYQVICSRIIFLLHYGYLTKRKFIDHIDNNPLNNKIENLRECTTSQNQQNRKISNKNTSGHKGVHWRKLTGKWQVKLKLNGKTYYFGHFVNKEDAIKVAIKERKKLHGQFMRNK